MQNQITGTLYQIAGTLSESFQKQSSYSCYSKEQAELLAQTPGNNTLTSSQENNRNLWGLFPHGWVAGRGCCRARRVLPWAPAPCCSSGSVQGTPWGSEAPRGSSP